MSHENSLKKDKLLFFYNTTINIHSIFHITIISFQYPCALELNIKLKVKKRRVITLPINYENDYNFKAIILFSSTK